MPLPSLQLKGGVLSARAKSMHFRLNVEKKVSFLGIEIGKQPSLEKQKSIITLNLNEQNKQKRSDTTNYPN